MTMTKMGLFGIDKARLEQRMEAPTTTPLKINMEHNHGGLEDHFPF